MGGMIWMVGMGQDEWMGWKEGSTQEGFSTFADFSSSVSFSTGGSIFTLVTPDLSTMSWMIRPFLPITLPETQRKCCQDHNLLQSFGVMII